MSILKINLFNVILLAVILGLISGICLAADPASSNKDYAVTSEPNAFEINKLIGRGVNIGNALESPNEGEWGVTLKEEYFQVIKDAGFNSIRLPVRWDTHALREAPYTIDANHFARIDWAIKNALSRNLVIVFNMHNYHEFYNDPNGHKERYLAIWRQIAEHYKDYPGTLLFEPLNEPQVNLKKGEWNAILRDVLSVIRKTNPSRMIVIGPCNFNEFNEFRGLDLPKDDFNIIVTFHYYRPRAFTHQGAHWEAGSEKNVGVKWMGSDQEKYILSQEFNVVAKWAKANNRPVFLGEFGSFYKGDMDSRIRWTKTVAETAEKCGFSMAYWEFCHNFFGLYDMEKKEWNKGLLDAVIGPKK